jgi:hypothetical protein
MRSVESVLEYSCEQRLSILTYMIHTQQDAFTYCKDMEEWFLLFPCLWHLAQVSVFSSLIPFLRPRNPKYRLFDTKSVSLPGWSLDPQLWFRLCIVCAQFCFMLTSKFYIVVFLHVVSPPAGKGHCCACKHFTGLFSHNAQQCAVSLCGFVL